MYGGDLSKEPEPKNLTISYVVSKVPLTPFLGVFIGICLKVLSCRKSHILLRSFDMLETGSYVASQG